MVLIRSMAHQFCWLRMLVAWLQSQKWFDNQFVAGIRKFFSKTSPESHYPWSFSKVKIRITFGSPVKSTSICIETITTHIIHWQDVIAMDAKLWWLVRSITDQNTFPHRRLWKSFSACNRPLVTKCNQMSCNSVKFSSLEMKNDVFWSVTCNRGV